VNAKLAATFIIGTVAEQSLRVIAPKLTEYVADRAACIRPGSLLIELSLLHNVSDQSIEVNAFLIAATARREN
jgi:hypothetical protein